jgi:gentisate 1,2-dioxygenase
MSDNLKIKGKYSAADFAVVPAQLRPIMPQGVSLIHRNVMGGGVAADAAFSGLRKHMVRTVNLPTTTLSMTIGGLEPSQASRRHRHTYETVIYILQGSGASTIEDEVVHWQAGDALYIPPWAWHSHHNSSNTASALYLACENAPLLQNLGAARREEE